MRRKTKKILSIVLSCALGLSTLSFPVIASEEEPYSEEITEEVMTPETDDELQMMNEMSEKVLTPEEMLTPEEVLTQDMQSEPVLTKENSDLPEETMFEEDVDCDADIILSDKSSDTEKKIGIQAYSDPWAVTNFRIYFWEYDGTVPEKADDWQNYFSMPFKEIGIEGMDEFMCIELPIYSENQETSEAQLIYDDESHAMFIDFTLPEGSYMDTEITVSSDFDAYVMAQADGIVGGVEETFSYLPIDFVTDSSEKEIETEKIYVDEAEEAETVPTEDIDDEFEMEPETEEDGVHVFDTMYFVNPVYEGIISADDLDHSENTPDAGITTLSSSSYAETLADAGADMREAMESRENPFTIKYIYPGTSIDSAGLTELMWDVWDEAFAHTGVPTEGDYMRWQYGGWSLSASYAKGDGFLYLNMKFDVTYYSTYEEEQQVTSKLNSVFADMNLGCKSDYDRICAIYDYICSNITYDYDNLYDSSYMTKFSAYGALCNGTAVCQGYAVLLYRMLLEAGVDCRVITGSGNGGAHAWNIVCINGKYYNVDSTWDAGRKNYSYFLKCDANFTSHTRGSDYSSSSFYASYPMATSNYTTADGGTEDHHTPGDWVAIAEATCTTNGLMQRTCTVCGTVVDSEIIPMLGHAYISEVTDPTCEDNGHVIEICSRCEQTYVSEVIPATGHAYQETVAVKPDCLTGGYSTFTCEICGDTYEGSHTNPTGHQYEDVEVPATCTEQGEIVKVCAVCGQQYIDSYTNPLGHNYVDGICTRCGAEQETEAETEHVHSFVPASEKDPTCTTAGEKVFSCACGEEDIEIIPATGQHDYAESDTVDATCGSHGLVTCTCQMCGDSYTEELPIIQEHSFEESGITEPDCIKGGSIHYQCSVCGHEYDDIIPALGHEPVKLDDGSYICERCHEVLASAEIPETEHEESETPTPESEDPETIPLGTYDITEAVITGIEEDYTYTGDEVMPKPVVTYNGTILTEDVDYILIYAHDVEVGYASVSVVGIGEYFGEVTFHYTIERTEHGDTPDLAPDAETETVTETQTESESEIEPETNEHKDISDAVVEGLDDSYEYTGEEITPDIRIMLDGQELVLGSDYEIEYLDDIEVGTATIVVTGIGDYEGELDLAFEIVKTEETESESETETETETEEETYGDGGTYTGTNIGGDDKETLSNPNEASSSNGLSASQGTSADSDDDESGAKGEGTVQTGDDFNMIGLMLSLAIIVSLAFLGLGFSRKKKA